MAAAATRQAVEDAEALVAAAGWHFARADDPDALGGSPCPSCVTAAFVDALLDELPTAVRTWEKFPQYFELLQT